MIQVSIDNFPRAESDLMFSRLLSDAGGVNQWIHYREPASLDHQPIVRANRDTLYSAAVVDVTRGATLTVPDAGDRYLSVMVVNQDHFIPAIFHEPGDHALARDALGTDYVLLAARTLVDPGRPRDVAQVNAIQDLLGVEAASSRPFELPPYDDASMERTRQALRALAEDMPDYTRAFGARDEVDPRRHLVASASGWGGLPTSEAHYINVTPGLPVRRYQMRMIDVPVDAFWSVSLYDADGYFVPNENGVNSINNITGTADPDGAMTISFGPTDDGRPNFLTIMEGWNLLIRLYRPRPEVLDGSWLPPAIQRVDG